MLMVMGTQMEMKVPMDMEVTQMEIVDQVGMETPQSNGNPQRERYSQRGGSNGNGDPPDRRRGPPRENGNPDGGDGGSDPDASGDGDDSSSSSDSTLPRRRRQRRPKCVYVLQGPQGPLGQEGQPGQPGQAGRDGRDGQALPLTRALEEALRVQRTNLDTTGLENSFS